MWHNTRHSVQFYFQNKEGISDISFKLRIFTRQFLRTIDDLQFDLNVTLSELLQKHQVSTRALLQKQEPQRNSKYQTEMTARQKAWEKPACSYMREKSVQTTLSSYSVSSDDHVQTLIKEGYTKLEAVEALDISRNRLVLARKLLQFFGEQLVSLQQPLPETKTLVTKNSATVKIPGTKVVLNIPEGALPEDMNECEVKMRIIHGEMFKDPAITFSSNASAVVEILPNNLTLQYPVQLIVPHCLLLKENAMPAAKIFMSHHEEGCPPCWVEHPHLKYKVESTHCVVWLNSFCWVTIKVDDKDVLAKKVILYACGKNLLPTHSYANVVVGYYPDLDGKENRDIDGEGKFLRLNKSMDVSVRSPFIFMKEGSYPLRLSLEKFSSSQWKLWSPKENVLEIPFKHISSFSESHRTFILEKTVHNATSPMCLFKASQHQEHQPVELAIYPEVDEDVPPSKSEQKYSTLKEQLRCCFMRLKGNLVRDWMDLGRYLHLSENELSRLGKEYKDDIEEGIYQMLLRWQQTSGSQATTEILIDALEELKRRDLAEMMGKSLNHGTMKRTVHSSLRDQSFPTTFSSSCVSCDVHFKTLSREGCTEHEVVEAPGNSRGRLVMARKVLQVLGKQLAEEVLSLCFH